jgi:hypothetical protein
MDSVEEQSKRNSITFVALNPYVAGHYFVASGDGTVQWNLPQEMHTDVKSMVENLRPLPADAPAQPDTATLIFQLAAHTGMVMNNMFRAWWREEGRGLNFRHGSVSIHERI